MARKVTAPVVLTTLIVLLLFSIIPGATAQSSTLYINEILVGNASTNLDTDYYNYSGWIEIYNGGNSAVDLKNYTLSYLDNGADHPINWKVPVSVSVPAKGRVIFWLDEQNKNRHANFELDMRGEWIKLLSPTNVVLDTVEYDMRGVVGSENNVLLPDISYGRQADGGAQWAYFDKPTPATANTGFSMADPILPSAPVFSPPGGYFSGNTSVSLSTTEPGGVIRYTTDGSIPTPSSPQYNGPINLTKPTVIRARVFAPGKLAGQPSSHTYLINVSRNLPVVSLATKPEHLFDNTIGIYVKGTNGITGRCSTVPVNWNRKWERPASIEMFETDGTRVIAQDVGFEIHGNCSRTMDRKSLEIKARRTYGDNDIDYQIFEDKPIDSYKRLILRNSGHDAEQMLLRDAIQHHIVMGMMDIDYMTARPVIVLLNGQYWGIYNLREKADEVYPEQNYDLDADADFDMIEKNSQVLAGSITAWNQFYNYIRSNDLKVPVNYQYVKSQIDLVEFSNYFIVEIYHNNTDWIGNNIRYWKAYDNGRWRWILFDLDWGIGPSKVADNYLNTVLKDTRNNSLLFRKLMQNTEFRNDFVQRFASHINITYDPARTSPIIAGYKAQLAPEIPAHIARWGTPTSFSAWESAVNKAFTFFNNRPAHMRNHLNGYLGSPGTANLTVNINGAGEVLAAGVKVPGSGYTGPYFKGIPMTLEAVSKPGAEFSHWAETGSTDPIITVTLSGNRTLTAVFDSAPPPPPIVITEIHYNPASSQGGDEEYEFIELYNAGSQAVNLSGFTTFEVEFTFPNGTSIAPGEYIVLAQTSATYQGKGYQVFQWTGGGLNNTSEEIALLDKAGQKVDTVTYADSGDWPSSPDGDGPSLSLLNPALDNSLPDSWAPSTTLGGSPGAANSFGPPPTTATLTVVKQVVGAAPAGAWQFNGPQGAFTLPAAGGQTSFSNLAPGSYTVSETAVSGYVAEASCSNGATGTTSVAVNLSAGDVVTCTFVNTNQDTPPPPATLTVVKQVVGAAPAGNWQFGGTLGTFTLPAAGGTKLFNGLVAGSYTVSETAVASYTAEVSCSNGASGTTSVTVNLSAGDAVTCTFTNTKQDEPPPTGSCDPVPGDLVVNGGFDNATTAWSFHTNGKGFMALNDATPSGCAPHIRVTTTTQGTNVQLLQTKLNLKPGTKYILRLSARSSANQDASIFIQKHTAPNTNYGLNGRVLDLTTEWQTFELPFQTTGFSSPVKDGRLRIWLAPYDLNNTYYEFDQISLVEDTGSTPPPTTGTLTVVKQVVGGAPAGAWPFNGPTGAFTLPAGGGQKVFADLAPGSYTVSETSLSGYSAAVTCSNGSSGTESVNVNLAAGDAVTCTFVNTNQSGPPPSDCTPVPGNVIANPGFELNTTSWTFHTSGRGSFTTTTQNPHECDQAAQVSIQVGGNNVQLFQHGIKLQANTNYVLTFAAKASSNRPIQVVLLKHGAPYTEYGLNVSFNLTTDWQVFTVPFRTKGFTGSVSDGRLRFVLQNADAPGDIFYFDGVSIAP